MHDKTVRERCIHNEVCKFEQCSDCKHFREDPPATWPPIWYSKDTINIPSVTTPNWYYQPTSTTTIVTPLDAKMEGT